MQKTIITISRQFGAGGRYNYYTNQNWGQAGNYDLCLNLSKISLEKAIRLIVDCVNERRTEK